MTIQEIAMAKNYLKFCGLDLLFVSLYKRNRKDTDLPSVEKYLMKADADKVFMDAFYFIPNHPYGFDFWRDKQDRFDHYRETRTCDYPEKDIAALTSHCKILRYNWDSQQIWKMRDKFETAKRYGIELSKDALKESISAKIWQGVATKRDYEILKENGIDMNEVPKRHIDVSEIEEEEETPNDTFKEFETEEDDFLSNLEEVQVRHGGRRLQEDEMSINTREGSRIIINQKLSIKLAQTDFGKVALKLDNQGRVYLVFNTQQGVNVTYQKSSRNAHINSVDMVGKMHTLLNLHSDYNIVKINCEREKDNYQAYRISKA